MKKVRVIKVFGILAALFLSFASCETETNKPENQAEENLYVKFENNAASEYTITEVRLLVMGVAGTYEEPSGEFSSNILPSETAISPGAHVFLNLSIPNSHYAYYRVTVDDGNGNMVHLHDQPNYANAYDGVITHWGSDDRTVEVTIVWSEISSQIIASGWSDFAGID